MFGSPVLPQIFGVIFWFTKLIYVDLPLLLNNLTNTTLFDTVMTFIMFQDYLYSSFGRFVRYYTRQLDSGIIPEQMKRILSQKTNSFGSIAVKTFQFGEQAVDLSF